MPDATDLDSMGLGRGSVTNSLVDYELVLHESEMLYVPIQSGLSADAAGNLSGAESNSEHWV